MIRGDPQRMPLIGGRNKFFQTFWAPLIYSTSIRLPLWLALYEGHVYCLWPLPCLLLVCSTLVCVLFVTSTTSTISVYYFNMCTVCAHYHVYY